MVDKILCEKVVNEYWFGTISFVSCESFLFESFVFSLAGFSFLVGYIIIGVLISRRVWNDPTAVGVVMMFWPLFVLLALGEGFIDWIRGVNEDE
jgi:hypothetical protein